MFFCDVFYCNTLKSILQDFYEQVKKNRIDACEILLRNDLNLLTNMYDYIDKTYNSDYLIKSAMHCRFIYEQNYSIDNMYNSSNIIFNNINQLCYRLIISLSMENNDKIYFNYFIQFITKYYKNFNIETFKNSIMNREMIGEYKFVSLNSKILLELIDLEDKYLKNRTDGSKFAKIIDRIIYFLDLFKKPFKIGSLENNIIKFVNQIIKSEFENLELVEWANNLSSKIQLLSLTPIEIQKPSDYIEKRRLKTAELKELEIKKKSFYEKESELGYFFMKKLEENEKLDFQQLEMQKFMKQQEPKKEIKEEIYVFDKNEFAKELEFEEELEEEEFEEELEEEEYEELEEEEYEELEEE